MTGGVIEPGSRTGRECVGGRAVQMAPFPKVNSSLLGVKEEEQEAAEIVEGRADGKREVVQS